MEIVSKIKISKDFYALMNKEVPLTTLAGGFAKIVEENYVFEINYVDGHLSVNDKLIN